MKNKINCKIIGKSLIISLILTIIMIFIVSLLLYFTRLREAKLLIINNIIMIISIFIPSIILSLKTKENGWLNGLILGVSYYLIFLLLNIFFFKENVIILFALGKIGLAGFIGSIGGIIGVNLK